MRKTSLGATGGAMAREGEYQTRGSITEAWRKEGKNARALSLPHPLASTGFAELSSLNACIIKRKVVGREADLRHDLEATHLGSEVVVTVTLLVDSEALVVGEVVNGGNWGLAVAEGAAGRRGGVARDSRDIAVGAVGPSVVGIDGELVSVHGVPGLGSDDLDVAGGTGVLHVGSGGGVLTLITGSRGIGGAHGRGAAGAEDVEDVEGDTAGGLLGGGLVWVERLKVAVKDEVVPVTLGVASGRLGELDVEAPGAGSGLGLSHVELGSVVVPRAEELDGLDVGGGEEGEGVARHFDGLVYGGIKNFPEVCV
jgi:hypothetical protein